MFGILRPSGTFMAFLSHSDGFIRCRDTLGGVVPPPAGGTILSSARAFLWCRKKTALQAVCPGESEQADQGPFSPNTGWANPQGRLTSQGLTFLIDKILITHL